MFLVLIMILGTTLFLGFNPLVPIIYDFTDYPLEIVFLIPICFLSHFFLLKVIQHKYDQIEDQRHSTSTESHGFLQQFNLNLYLFDQINIIKGSKRRKLFFVIVGSVLIMVLSLLYPEEFRNSLITIYGLLVTGVCIYLLFWKFSNITLEREFNMEELILSRISVNQYIVSKINFLLKGPLRWLIVPSILVIFLTGIGIQTLIILSMFFRIIYLVSVMLLLWRLLPSKNLLGSSILTVFLIEVVGIMFSYYMLGAGGTLFLVSPILSTFLSVLLQKPQNYSDMGTISSIMISILVSITFLLASSILVKAQVRFE